MDLTIFKCEFLLTLAEWMTKTSFGITLDLEICNNGNYKFCILKINYSIILLSNITKLFCCCFRSS